MWPETWTSTAAARCVVDDDTAVEVTFFSLAAVAATAGFVHSPRPARRRRPARERSALSRQAGASERARECYGGRVRRVRGGNLRSSARVITCPPRPPSHGAVADTSRRNTTLPAVRNRPPSCRVTSFAPSHVRQYISRGPLVTPPSPSFLDPCQQWSCACRPCDRRTAAVDRPTVFRDESSRREKRDIFTPYPPPH